MDLGTVDPQLLERLDRMIDSVSWGGAVLVAAIALRVGGPSLARIILAIRKGQS
jgi:hypothetical protein